MIEEREYLLITRWAYQYWISYNLLLAFPHGIVSYRIRNLQSNIHRPDKQSTLNGVRAVYCWYFLYQVSAVQNICLNFQV